MAKPKPIGNILAELWPAAATAGCKRPTLAPRPGSKRPARRWPRKSRAGQVRRGVLEVCVANSTLVQELAFEKSRLLETLTATDAGRKNPRPEIPRRTDRLTPARSEPTRQIARMSLLSKKA